MRSEKKIEEHLAIMKEKLNQLGVPLTSAALAEVAYYRAWVMTLVWVLEED